jgi:hypothetical protein
MGWTTRSESAGHLGKRTSIYGILSCLVALSLVFPTETSSRKTTLSRGYKRQCREKGRAKVSSCLLDCDGGLIGGWYGTNKATDDVEVLLFVWLWV